MDGGMGCESGGSLLRKALTIFVFLSLSFLQIFGSNF